MDRVKPTSETELLGNLIIKWIKENWLIFIPSEIIIGKPIFYWFPGRNGSLFICLILDNPIHKNNLYHLWCFLKLRLDILLRLRFLLGLRAVFFVEGHTQANSKTSRLLSDNLLSSRLLNIGWLNTFL